jgi:hypothetical protein
MLEQKSNTPHGRLEGRCPVPTPMKSPGLFARTSSAYLRWIWWRRRCEPARAHGERWPELESAVPEVYGATTTDALKEWGSPTMT